VTARRKPPDIAEGRLLPVVDQGVENRLSYPVKSSRYHLERLAEPDWEQQSPQLVIRRNTVGRVVYAALHFPQVKPVKAATVRERCQDPNLVTIGVDLNIKHTAVVTVRQSGRIIKTVFLHDHGLDARRYKHLLRIAYKQRLSGKPVQDEHSNQDLWQHICRMNLDAARKVARQIADIAVGYPGAILLFEARRRIKAKKGESKSRRWNRRRANELRGVIRDFAKEMVFAKAGIITLEVNPHGTSQYCSRCAAKGERFSLHKGERRVWKGGSLFRCPACGYEANADFNASVNVHHSFYREFHWAPKKKNRELGAMVTPRPAIGRVSKAAGVSVSL
jgi:transposase